MATIEKIIELFTTALDQIKLYHWAVLSYPAHKALGDLHDVLSDKVDLFVESYIGRFKKQPLPVFQVTTKASSDVTKVVPYLESIRDSMKLVGKNLQRESQLLNIIDEMVTEIDKTLYLLNLH